MKNVLLLNCLLIGSLLFSSCAKVITGTIEVTEPLKIEINSGGDIYYLKNNIEYHGIYKEGDVVKFTSKKIISLENNEIKK